MKYAVIAAIAAASTMLSAGSAGAAVVYSFHSSEGAFQATLADFAASLTKIPIAELDSCSSHVGDCSPYEILDPADSTDDRVVFLYSYVDRFGHTAEQVSPYIFADGALSKVGNYVGDYQFDVDGRQKGYLSVSQVADAVPEPATWAMMLLGFGGLGAVLRRPRAFA